MIQKMSWILKIYTCNTSAKHAKFLYEGDISQNRYKHARISMKPSIIISNLLLNKFEKNPLDNPSVCNAVWVNALGRVNTKWEHVQYFYDLFPNLMFDISSHLMTSMKMYHEIMI